MKGQNLERQQFFWDKTSEMLNFRPWKLAFCMETGDKWAFDVLDRRFLDKVYIWGKKREGLERCQRKFGACFGEHLLLRKTDWCNLGQLPSAEIIFGDLTESFLQTDLILKVVRETGAVYGSFLTSEEGNLVLEMQANGMDLAFYRDYSVGKTSYFRMDFQKIF